MTHPQTKGRKTLEAPQVDQPADGKRKPVEQTPETVAETRDAKKMHVKGKSARSRADISLQNLEGKSEERVAESKLDTETAEIIERIDVNKECKEQLAECQRLELVNYTLFAKLFHYGMKVEDLRDLFYLKNISINAVADLNDTEKAAFAKLQEISSRPESKLYQDLKPKWEEFVNKIYTLYSTSPVARPEAAANAAAAIAATTPPSQSPTSATETAADEPRQKEGFFRRTAKSIWGFTKKHKYEILTTAVVAAAAYGAYRIFFKKSQNGAASPAEGKSLADRLKLGSFSGFSALKIGGGVVLGGLILGAIAGPKNIKKWLEKMYKWPSEKVDQFITKFKEGNYWEAFKCLFSGTEENWPEHKALAEKLKKETGKDISTKTIKSISKVKYSKFMALGNGKTALSILAGEFAEKAKESFPGASMIIDQISDNDPDQAEEEKVIREYLQKNQQRVTALNLGPDATMLEVLGKLNDVKVPVVAPKENASQGALQAVETGADKAVGLSTDIMDDLAKEFADKPKFQAFLKEYREKGWSTILSPHEFIAGLLNVCHEEGIPIVIGAGKITLKNGSKFIVLTSADTFYNTAKAMVEAPFSDKVGWSDVITTYAEGTMSFVIIGAVVGGIGGALSKTGGTLSGALKGAGEGFIFPVTAAKYTAWGAQRVYRTARGAQFAISKMVSSAEALPQILRNQTRFYAEIFDKYDRLSSLSESFEFQSNLNPQKWYGKLTKARVDRLKKEYLSRFQVSYNKLQTALGKEGATTLPDASIKGEAPPAAQVAKNFLREEAAKSPSGPSTAAVAGAPSGVPEAAPEHLKTDGTGATAVHHYKLNGTEVALKESEIAAKAAEIGKAKTPAAAGQETVWAERNWQEAIKILSEEQILTPVPVAGKPGTYSFQGHEYSFTPDQIAAKKIPGASETDAVKSLCYERLLAHVNVQDVKILADGTYRYKIEGEWIENLKFDKPAKVAEVKVKFQEELQKQGISIDFEKFASESKALQYFTVVERIIGTAAAVLFIYQLEKAPDKRKAVAEAAAGFGSFWAGMKLTDWQVGSRITPNTPGKMMARTVIDIMGGIAVSYGLTEPIGKLMEHYYSKVPGSYGVSRHLINIFEKATARATVHMVLQSAERGILRKVIVGVGLDALVKPIGSALLKKVAALATRTGFKQVMGVLGWRGATTVALLADDATIIGIVDDLIAIGFAVWMAWDIYKIIKLIANAVNIKNEMEKREPKAIKSFVVKDVKSRAELQTKLAVFGLTVDTAMQRLDAQALFDLLRTLPQTAVEIKREGMPGKEIWTLNKGEAVGIAVLDDGGKVIAEIADEDAKQIDQTFQNIDSAQAKKAA